MTFEYEFRITTPIEVFESLGPNKVRAGGTFIRLEVPTKNGRIYKVNEAEQIAKDLNGKALYIHATPEGKHYNTDKMLVGQVVETIVDEAKKLIKGFVEIWNTPDFPNLVDRVKKGWGFSIGGVVEKFIPTGYFNEKLKPIVHAIGMRANHLQLLEPEEKRGDPEAQVSELIPVMESLQLSPDPFQEIEVTSDIENPEVDTSEIVEEVQETEKITPRTVILNKKEWTIIYDMR